ncbi:hypothetical protein [Sporomusa aerivorans]|uniref:hypothetical protein n=1 Tax=Sporomusa aerivorans TaxID=204936 RepID=UPI00352AFD48
MLYFFILLAILAAIHASCFGVWLFKNGNKPGAAFVFAFSLLCVVLPFYRLLTAK